MVNFLYKEFLFVFLSISLFADKTTTLKLILNTALSIHGKENSDKFKADFFGFANGFLSFKSTGNNTIKALFNLDFNFLFANDIPF